MNKSRICLLTLVLIGSLFMNSARAQQNPLAFTGARILPIGKPAGRTLMAHRSLGRWGPRPSRSRAPVRR